MRRGTSLVLVVLLVLILLRADRPVRLPRRLSAAKRESPRSSGDSSLKLRAAACRYLAYSDGGPGTGGRLAPPAERRLSGRLARDRGSGRGLWACGRSGQPGATTQRTPRQPRSRRNVLRDCGRDTTYSCASQAACVRVGTHTSVGHGRSA